ncbi:TPA: MFS transporter [Klebsiella pneumoniae]|uniref:MFS transporter n=8 Tax=Klebsiella pneumoniae TaxID=573 RepID=A0A2V3KC44_KLEPN|nr:MFS transporter [Klebsiella pneumoniae]AHM84423.1 Multidrug resistance protein B [Klebsiella pneumoniae 30660/NJST258_1]AKR99583.1 major facilitator transporter [Klebsiella pneumoniae UHKPC33]EJK26326.1 putative MFS-family transport protein [Klebsiella pneumoniae subsp. pneumoniae KPNIH19]ENY56920.1 MFS family transporter [Klebsiella pneumoniae subsp. pneumoniae KpMDU1]CCM82533.1 Permeases of the major facilitator superfamily [Klebsiella pneumoniae subsp. pneumoniae ST258-K26BO]CCM91212.1 
MNTAISSRDERAFSAPALLVAGAFFMEFLDGTVIATALPDMARDFGVTAVELNIGISAYLITLAVLIPASGWIADRFGARAIFTLALAIFTLASVFCGLSTEVHIFVAMRILQGVGGALMVPVGRLAVLRTTPKHQLIKAIATLTWPALVAPIIGPPLGGFITRYASWHWIFFINVPLGLAAIILSLRIIPDIRETERRSFDLSGFITTSVAMVSLVTAMERLGDRQPQIWPTLALAALGFGCLLYSIRHFRRAAAPMVRLDALQVPTFRVTMYGGSLFRASISAVPFLLPLLFQVGFGMDPFHSGLLMLAVFVGNLTIKPATTPLIRWLGFRRLLLINGALNVCSLLACALLTPQTPVWAIMLILYLGGVFRSIQFTGVSTLAFADVPAAQMSDANTLFSTASQLAVGLGITLGAIGIRLGEQVGDWLHLTELPGISFRLSFVFIALICLVGMIDSLHLAKTAGSSVSEKKK